MILKKYLLPLLILQLCATLTMAVDSPDWKTEEIDTDNDGKIDKKAYYNQKGQLVKQIWNIEKPGKQKSMTLVYDDNDLKSSTIDSNQNGITDVWIDYKDNLRSQVRRDKNEDGKVEYWGYYSGGVLDRSAIDTNNDGQPDRWFYYVGKQVVRSEEDRNYDGKADFVSSYRKGKLHIEQDKDFDGKFDTKSF